jgi:hypothetical protein
VLEPALSGITFRKAAIDGAAEPLVASCALALALERMSHMLAERNVVELAHFGIYGCRTIAGTSELSQHALARAFDLGAVKLSTGEVYTVLTDREITPPAASTPADTFLHDLVRSLFDGGVFNIILTPNFNAEHRNHFHFDLTPNAHFTR